MQRIYVFFGMIASGKSTLARGFADRCRLPYFNTDRVRKELAGLSPTSRRAEEIDQGIYSGEFTRRTYQAMLDYAGKALREGRSVVLDGSYHRRRDREQVRATAGNFGAACVFVMCECSDEEVMRRLDIRSRDQESVSDGRWEIYLVQKQKFEAADELSPAELIILNTEQEVEVLLDRLDDELAMK